MLNIRNRFLVGCYVQRGYKNRDFRPISRLISQTTQDGRSYNGRQIETRI